MSNKATPISSSPASIPSSPAAAPAKKKTFFQKAQTVAGYVNPLNGISAAWNGAKTFGAYMNPISNRNVKSKLEAVDLEGVLTNALLNDRFPLLSKLKFYLLNAEHFTFQDLRDLKITLAELLSKREDIDEMFKGPEKRVKDAAQIRQEFQELLSALHESLRDPDSKRSSSSSSSSVSSLSDNPRSQEKVLTPESFRIIKKLLPVLDTVIFNNRGALINGKEYLQGELTAVIGALMKKLDHDINTEPDEGLILTKEALQEAISVAKKEIASNDPKAVFGKAAEALHEAIEALAGEEEENDVPHELTIAQQVLRELSIGAEIRNDAIIALESAEKVLNERIREQSGVLPKAWMAIQDAARKLTNTLPKVVRTAADTLDDKLNKEPSPLLINARDALTDLADHIGQNIREEDAARLIHNANICLSTFLGQEDENGLMGLSVSQIRQLRNVQALLNDFPYDLDEEIDEDLDIVKEAASMLHEIAANGAGSLVRPRLAIANMVRDVTNSVPKVLERASDTFDSRLNGQAPKELSQANDALSAAIRLLSQENLEQNAAQVVPAVRSAIAALRDLKYAPLSDSNRHSVQNTIGLLSSFQEANKLSQFDRAEDLPSLKETQKRLKDLVREESGIIAKSTQSLTDAGQEMLDHAGEMVASQLKQADTVLTRQRKAFANAGKNLLTQANKAIETAADTLNDKLNKEPSPLLTNARDALADLADHIGQNIQDDDAIRLIANAEEKLSTFLDQNDSKSTGLTKPQIMSLERIRTFLNDLANDECGEEEIVEKIDAIKKAVDMLYEISPKGAGSLVTSRLAIANTVRKLANSVPKVLERASDTLDSRLNGQAPKEFLQANDALSAAIRLLSQDNLEQNAAQVVPAVRSAIAALRELEDAPLSDINRHIVLEAIELLSSFQEAERLRLFDKAKDLLLLRETQKRLKDLVREESGIIAKSAQSLTDAGNELMSHADEILSRQRREIDLQLTGKPDAALARARDDFSALNRALENGHKARKLAGKALNSLRDFYQRAPQIFQRALNDQENRFIQGVIAILANNSMRILKTPNGRKLCLDAFDFLDQIFVQKSGMGVKLTAQVNDGIGSMAQTVDSVLNKNRKKLEKSVENIEKRVALEPPKVLRQARKRLNNLIQALKSRAKPEEIVPLYRKAAQAVLAFIEGNRQLKKPLDAQEIQLLRHAVSSESAPSLVALQEGLDVIDEKYREEAGLLAKFNLSAVSTADEVAGAFDRTVAKTMAEVRDLPRQIVTEVADMFGFPAPAAKTPAERTEKADSKSQGADAASKSDAPRTSSLGSFLDGAKSYFESFLSNATGAIKKESVVFAATTLASCLEFIKEPQLRGNIKGMQIIDKLIATLKMAPKQNNWNEIVALLKQCPAIVGGLQISLLGRQLHTFKAPATVGKPEDVENSSFKKNILKARDALNIQAAQAAPINYGAEVEGQKDLLVTNLSEYTPMRAVFENICGLAPENGDAFYFELQRRAHAPGVKNPESELRKLFFQALDKAPLSAPRRWIAKLAYWIISPISQFGLGKFFNEFIEHAKEQIDQYDKNGFKKFSTNSIENFNTYLSTTIGAHKRAKKNDNIDGTFLHMVGDELQKPFVNKVHGKPHTPKELYAAVAKEAVDSFVPALGWCDKIAAFFEKIEISSESSFHFANPVVKVAMFLVSALIRVIIFLPEIGLNKLINFVLKKYIIRHEIVDGILDKSVNAVRDANGYSNAINKILLAQLENIWEIMKDTESTASLDKGVSLSQKQELTAAVKELFKVLKLNAKATHAEAMSELSLFEKGIEEIDNLFIQDVVETATTLIGVALKSVMQKDQFEKQMYNFMHLMNQSFEVGAATSLEEFHQNETRIAELIDVILTSAIRTAVRKKFDFSGNQGTEATEKCVKTIQEKTSSFITAATTALADGAMTKEIFTANIFNPFLEYQKEMDQQKGKVEGTKEISSGPRDEIKKFYAQLEQKCEILGDIFAKINKGLSAGENCSDLIKVAQQRMGEIQRWAKEIEMPPHVNILPPQAGGFVETLEDLTFNRVRYYVDELVKTIRQPQYYRHLFHHMALIPFLENAAAKRR